MYVCRRLSDRTLCCHFYENQQESNVVEALAGTAYLSMTHLGLSKCCHYYYISARKICIQQQKVNNVFLGSYRPKIHTKDREATCVIVALIKKAHKTLAVTQQ